MYAFKTLLGERLKLSFIRLETNQGASKFSVINIMEKNGKYI